MALAPDSAPCERDARAPSADARAPRALLKLELWYYRKRVNVALSSVDTAPGYRNIKIEVRLALYGACIK